MPPLNFVEVVTTVGAWVAEEEEAQHREQSEVLQWCIMSSCHGACSAAGGGSAAAAMDLCGKKERHEAVILVTHGLWGDATPP